MRTSDHVMKAGEVSQILPSFVRSVCRSRFEYDPDELLNEYRMDAVREIEGNPVFALYRFPARHVCILCENSLEIFRVEIRRALSVNTLVGCSYQRELRKRACWTCPVARQVILLLEGSGTDGSDE